MTDTAFSALWADALTHTDRDAYVSRWMLSSIWGDDPESDISQDHIDYLGRIWDVAHMTVAQIRATTGLTQGDFAERFCLSRRTVEDWESRNKCPNHIRLMMAEILGIIER